MPETSPDKPRYPLLKNLLLVQLVALASGISLLYFAYYWISQSYVESAQKALREEVRPRLVAKQEELRTWQHLGLVTAVARGLEEIRQSLPLKRLEVLPSKEVPHVTSPLQLVIPEGDDPLMDLKVYGELDPAVIYRNYSLNRVAFYGFGLLTALFIGVLLFSLRYIFKHIYRPLLSVDRRFRSLADTGCFDVDGIEAAGEIRVFISRIKEMHEKANQAERQAALVEVSRQVAHDIRSPLAALSVLDSSLTELPEEKRLLLRSAISRVNDIANTLLIRSRGGSDIHGHSIQLDPMGGSVTVTELDQTVLLPSLIESLLTEKRLQYNQRQELSIQLTPTVGMHGLFCRIQPNELKRVLSNLVNNSAEAVEGQGEIGLFASGGSDFVSILVKDTGRGIAPELVEELACSSVSYGKPTGTGLGIPHARKAVSSWGGSLSIRSQVGVGTEVEIRLPRAVPPVWHVPVLELPARSRLVVLDDDITIHQVWRERLKAVCSTGSLGSLIESHHFFSAADFSLWFTSQRPITGRTLYLVDYELRGESRTGLSLIASLGLNKDAILVSSHAEETHIQEACSAQGIRLLPKNMAVHVPIVLRDTRGRLDLTPTAQAHA